MSERPYLDFRYDGQDWRLAMVGGIPRLDQRIGEDWRMVQLDYNGCLMLAASALLLARLDAADSQSLRLQRERDYFASILLRHGLNPEAGGALAAV